MKINYNEISKTYDKHRSYPDNLIKKKDYRGGYTPNKINIKIPFRYNIYK